jgi:hypothetical protein
MNRARIAVAAVFVTGSMLGALVAGAQEERDKYGPPARAPNLAVTPGASASAATTAFRPEEIAPPAPSGRPVWQPDFSRAAVPTETSPAPTAAEWKQAPIAAEARVTAPNCEVRRLREWYRVGCPSIDVEVVSGHTKDLTGDCESDGYGSCRMRYVVFPARRGDRRVIEFFVFGGWGGPRPWSLMSEQFLGGDRLPLITVEGIRGGF